VLNSSAIVEDLLNYLYSDSVVTTPDLLIETLEATKEWGITGLERLLEGATLQVSCTHTQKWMFVPINTNVDIYIYISYSLIRL